MSTAAISQPQPTPAKSTKANLHHLLRRGMRLVEPITEEQRLEQEAIRTRALAALNTDACTYYELKELEEEVKKEIAILKPGIEEAVKQIGVVPDSAPKSVRADTPGYVCTVTTGSSMEIDDEIVLQLDLQMHTPEQQKLFDLLFVRRVEYGLAPGAQDVMQHMKLPRGKAALIRKLYALAFKAKTGNPSLKVESKAAIEADRQAAIAKAAAKKAGKKAAKVVA